MTVHNGGVEFDFLTEGHRSQRYWRHVRSWDVQVELIENDLDGRGILALKQIEPELRRVPPQHLARYVLGLNYPVCIRRLGFNGSQLGAPVNVDSAQRFPIAVHKGDGEGDFFPGAATTTVLSGTHVTVTSCFRSPVKVAGGLSDSDRLSKACSAASL